MARLEAENLAMLRSCNAVCAYAPACAHGLDLYKSWALCGNLPGLASLGGICTRPPGCRQTIAGKRLPSGAYLSSATAEYPPSLARAIAHVLSPVLSGFRRSRNPGLRLAAARLHCGSSPFGV